MTAISRPTEPLLAGDFPAYDEQSWRELVGKVLKGSDFDKRLVRPTADGISIRPLYTRCRQPADRHPRRGTVRSRRIRGRLRTRRLGRPRPPRRR